MIQDENGDMMVTLLDITSRIQEQKENYYTIHCEGEGTVVDVDIEHESRRLILKCRGY